MSRQSERSAILLASSFCLLVAGVVSVPSARSIGDPPLLEKRARPADAARALSNSICCPLPEYMTSDRGQVQQLIAMEFVPIEEPLQPAASLRGRVSRGDGVLECRAELWNAGAHAIASTEGDFELCGANLEQPLIATLPGFQPAREEHPGTDGNLLRLGPPTLKIEGRLHSDEGRASEGWRMSLLDASLIEPLRADAATLEAASSRSPRRAQSTADGRFCIDGLTARPYSIAAWRAARARIELYATAPLLPEQGMVELRIPPANECRSIELRCVDAQAFPLAHLRIGLPGAAAIASTDAQGRLTLSGALPPSLRLIVSNADGKICCQLVDCSASADVVVDLR